MPVARWLASNVYGAAERGQFHVDRIHSAAHVGGGQLTVTGAQRLTGASCCWRKDPVEACYFIETRPAAQRKPVTGPGACMRSIVMNVLSGLLGIVLDFYP